jgi:hypothetical protein
MRESLKRLDERVGKIEEVLEKNDDGHNSD